MRNPRSTQPATRQVPSRTLIIDASGVVHSVLTSNPNRQASHGDRIKTITSLKESR